MARPGLTRALRLAGQLPDRCTGGSATIRSATCDASRPTRRRTRSRPAATRRARCCCCGRRTGSVSTDRLPLGVLSPPLGGADHAAGARRRSAASAARRPARRYLPVLVLAPYAVWVAVSVDVRRRRARCRGMVALGVRASAHRRAGCAAAGWALAAGVLLGVAALFSYAAPWLGLSVVCLYFARRRAFLNVATGSAPCCPCSPRSWPASAGSTGCSWRRADYAARVEPYRSALWWSAHQPGRAAARHRAAAGRAALRKLRNTPGWPFLVGAGAAVVVLARRRPGPRRRGAAWLPFFPWLTVAAVAPETPGRRAAPTPRCCWSAVGGAHRHRRRGPADSRPGEQRPTGMP